MQTILIFTSRLTSLLICVFLLAPLLILLPISFTDSNFFLLPVNGLSTKWYVAVLQDAQWSQAASNSLVVAVVSTALSVLLGTSAACGIVYMGRSASAAVYALLLSPLVIPTIVVALALYINYSQYGLTTTRLGLILAHAALSMPFVIVAVVASLRKYDVRLFQAALSLGADYGKAFRHAVMPSIGPSIIVGAIYAFNVSFDESIISLFLARPEQSTLPKLMYSGITDNITPAVAVVAILTTICSLVLMVVYWILNKKISSN